MHMYKHTRHGQAVTEWAVAIAIVACAAIIGLALVSGAAGGVYSSITSSIGRITGPGASPSPSGSPSPSPSGSPTASPTGGGVASPTPPPTDQVAYLALNPLYRTINTTANPDGHQVYSAEAFDSQDNYLGDVTAWANFSIGGDGTCAANSCGSTTPDTYTVNAVYGNGSGTASLTVVVLTPGQITSLSLAPSTSTILPGGSQAYAAEGYGANPHDLGDVTSLTAFSIDPTSGSCAANACGASDLGDYTVTGTGTAAAFAPDVTATASLTVAEAPIKPPDPLPGSPVTISGGGFCADSQVQVLWDGVAIAAATADSYGSVEITFTPTAEQSAAGSTHHVTLSGLMGDCSTPYSYTSPPLTISPPAPGIGSDILDTFNRPDSPCRPSGWVEVCDPGVTTPDTGYFWTRAEGTGFKVYKHQFTGVGEGDNNHDAETLLAPLPFPFRLTIDVIKDKDGEGNPNADPLVSVSLNGGYTVEARWTIFGTASITLYGPDGGMVDRTSGYEGNPMDSGFTMTVQAGQVTALGLVLTLPDGFSSANNPTIRSYSSSGGEVVFDNFFVTGDLNAPIPHPDNGFVPFRGLLDTFGITAGPDSNGVVTLTAHTTQDVTLTPDLIFIQPTDPNAGPMTICDRGDTCQVNASLPDAGSEIWKASVADIYGPNAGTTYTTITLHAPTPTDTWGVTLDNSPFDKYHDQLTASVSPDTQASSTLIDIWKGTPNNPSAAVLQTECPTYTVFTPLSGGTSCQVSVPNSQEATYYATASFVSVLNLVGTSNTVSVPAVEFSLDPAWTVGLSAGEPGNGQITLTATSNQDVSLTPYDIYIQKVSNGYADPLATCTTGTTCQVAVSSSDQGTYFATVTYSNAYSSDGSGAIAISDQIPITPTPTPTPGPTLPDYARTGTPSCTSCADIAYLNDGDNATYAQNFVWETAGSKLISARPTPSRRFGSTRIATPTMEPARAPCWSNTAPTTQTGRPSKPTPWPPPTIPGPSAPLPPNTGGSPTLLITSTIGWSTPSRCSGILSRPPAPSI